MKYVYLLILCTIAALIISFRKYKSEMFSSLSKKEAPLKFLYGFSMIIITLINKIIKEDRHAASEKLYNKLKSVSFCLCAFTIIIFFGFLYSITTTSSDSKPDSEKLSDNEVPLESSALTAPEATEPDSTSSFTENESYNKIKNAISIFESHREEIEKAFLNENVSCLSITEPLKLITEYGDENISIAWTFEPDNVIDSQGNIIYENVSNEGCSTLAYAELTLDDVTATLTIPIFISPP